MAVVDELITILGLKADRSVDSEASRVSGALESVRNGAAVAGAALIAGAGAVTVWVTSLSSATDEGKKFADSIGVSFEAMQELEFAVQRSGGSVSELRSDLDNLTKTMSSPVPGEFNQALAIMGISARNASGALKTSDEILTDLSKRFEGLSAQKQVQLGAKLGLSSSTIKLLQNGREGIEELRKEAQQLGGIISDEDALNVAEFNDRLLDMQTVLKGIATGVGVSLLPAFTDLFTVARDFFFANREIISAGLEQFIDGVAEGFGIAWDVMSRVVETIGDMVDGLFPLNSDLDATHAIAIAVAGVLLSLVAAAAAAAAPFLAMAAGATAVVLVLEDLWTFFEGGDSVIGGFVDQFENRFPALFDLLRAFGTLIQETLLAPIQLIIDGWTEIFDLLSSIDVSEGITDALDFLESTAASFGFGDSVAPPSPAALSAGGGVTNNLTQNINGAGDPRAVGQEAANRAGISGSLQVLSPSFNRPGVN